MNPALTLRKPLELTRKLGLPLSFGIIIAIGIVSYRETHSLLETNRKLTHTHAVIAAIEAVFSTLKDAESGRRGYVITGDERHLDQA